MVIKDFTENQFQKNENRKYIGSTTDFSINIIPDIFLYEIIYGNTMKY